METLLDWIFANKEWLFSGAGFGIAIIILRLIFKGMTKPSTSQKIRSGNNSINIQANRDVQINSGSKSDDAEKK